MSVGRGLGNLAIASNRVREAVDAVKGAIASWMAAGEAQETHKAQIETTLIERLSGARRLWVSVLHARALRRGRVLQLHVALDDRAGRRFRDGRRASFPDKRPAGADPRIS